MTLKMEAKRIAGIILLIIGIALIIGGVTTIVNDSSSIHFWIYRIQAAVLCFIGGFLSITGLILLIPGRKKD